MCSLWSVCASFPIALSFILISISMYRWYWLESTTRSYRVFCVHFRVNALLLEEVSLSFRGKEIYFYGKLEKSLRFSTEWKENWILSVFDLCIYIFRRINRTIQKMMIGNLCTDRVKQKFRFCIIDGSHGPSFFFRLLYFNFFLFPHNTYYWCESPHPTQVSFVFMSISQPSNLQESESGRGGPDRLLDAKGRRWKWHVTCVYITKCVYIYAR